MSHGKRCIDSLWSHSIAQARLVEESETRRNNCSAVTVRKCTGARAAGRRPVSSGLEWGLQGVGVEWSELYRMKQSAPVGVQWRGGGREPIP